MNICLFDKLFDINIVLKLIDFVFNYLCLLRVNLFNVIIVR